MKKATISLVLLMVFSLITYSVRAQSVTLSPTDDSYVWSVGATDKNGNEPEIAAARWTWGPEGTLRSYLKFDLSSIPSNAVLVSAKLELKAPAVTSAVQGGHQGDNAWRLENVIADWDETTIDWNNKPATDQGNTYFIPATTSSSQNYSLDITTLAIKWHEGNPSVNYGIMMRLATEEKFRSVVFASKEHANSTLHPTLVVNYYVPSSNETSLTLKLDNSNSADAYLWSGIPTDQNGDNPELGVAQWSWGAEGTIRSVIKFDMSSINSGAVIKRAYLRLYGNHPNSSAVQGGHQGDNEWYVQRVTEDWDENTVTWNSKPGYSVVNQVEVEKSEILNQDYCIDITNLVKDILNSGNNYGLHLMLKNEAMYRALMFASSENANADLHPMVEIYYETAPSGIGQNSAQGGVVLYPNPSKGVFYVGCDNDRSFLYYTVYDATGKRVLNEAFYEGMTQIDLASLPIGMYSIALTDRTGNCQTFKVTVLR